MRLFFALACALFAQTSGLFAQGVQIHTKPARSTPASSDLLILEDASNTTWKIRLDQIAAFVGSLSGAGDASTNTITSVDGEIVLFSGTTGKQLKRGNSLTGIPKLTAGVVGISTAHKDFASDTAQTGTDANNTWTAGVTSFAEGVALTGDRTLSLPPTTDFADSTVIRLIDSKTASVITTQNFGRLMTPSGSDTLNGVGAAAWVTAGYYQPFKAGGYGGGSKVRYFEKRGTNWQSVGDTAAVLYFQNQSNPTARATINGGNLPPGTDTPFTLPSSAFTGLVPSESSDVSSIAVTGADANGNLIYNALDVVPSTSLHSTGEVLSVLNDGSAGWLPTATGNAPWQVLDNSTSPIVWTLSPGSKQQNAVLVMPAGNRTITVNGTVSSGYEFNLVVKQDATGGRTVTLPTGSFVTGNGLGVALGGGAANQIDWIYGKYLGQPSGFAVNYIWTAFTNATAAAPPTCATLGVTGATSGTLTLLQNAANRDALSNNFLADATSICKVEANIQRIASANYDLRVYICPDVARVTFAGASTSNGSNTVTLGASGILTGDIGNAITGPGIPANTYVGSVDTTANTLTLSSSRTSNVSVNAGGGAGAGTVTVFGAPGTPINAAGSDPVNTTSLPTALTGTGSADDTPAVFTNVGVSGLTVGANYWLVIATGATFGSAGWDASNYAAWLQPVSNASGYHTMRASSTAGPWSYINNTKQQRFKTYH